MWSRCKLGFVLPSYSHYSVWLQKRWNCASTREAVHEMSRWIPVRVRPASSVVVLQASDVERSFLFAG